MYPRAAVKQLAASKRRMYVGNHSTHNEYVNKDGVSFTVKVFVYFWTPICYACEVTKRFYVTSGGWGTRSTSAAIAAYRELFRSKQYTEVASWDDVTT